MRFLFLGTGTSAGIPAIGCDCHVCTSPDPRDSRLRTAAAVLWTDPFGVERTALLDAGPDLRQQALRAGLRRCDAIFFTHNHVDHTFGLDEVRRFNALQRTPIPIYAEPHTLDHLRRVYKHVFERDANVNDSFVASLIPHALAPGVAVELFGVSFTPFRMLHGRLPIVGYRVEPAAASPLKQDLPPGSPFPLAYCTDVSGVPTESWRYLSGLGTLVLDALRHRHHPTHLTLGQAVHLAEKIAARRTFFVHMAHDLAHEETNASLPAGMALAHDGLELAASIAQGETPLPLPRQNPAGREA
ncbi:MAG: MBL fold metallo-hydrolase [Phycisphaerae bacterium]|nr:MBL fold metallo-hydrolase [Phycisphaerae bacterium]